VVADSGVGIMAEALPVMFGAFTRADDSTARRFEGSGVGLAVAQRFCALLGGDIRVASELGEGTVFLMQIPLDAGERWAAHTGAREPAAPP
jgi:signal transduction histidine kinase